MTIKKVKGGCVVLHHRTPGKIGTRIPATKKPVSCKKAKQIQGAIFARRADGSAAKRRVKRPSKKR